MIIPEDERRCGVSEPSRKKFILELPEEAYQTLVEISRRNGTTLNETIRKSLELFKVVEQREKSK